MLKYVINLVIPLNNLMTQKQCRGDCIERSAGVAKQGAWTVAGYTGGRNDERVYSDGRNVCSVGNRAGVSGVGQLYGREEMNQQWQEGQQDFEDFMK
jgi:hypothetical protein